MGLFLPNSKREAEGILHLLVSNVAASPTRAPQDFKKGVLIVPGFGVGEPFVTLGYRGISAYFYRALVAYLEEMGMGSVVVDVPWLSPLAPLYFQDTLDEHVDNLGTIWDEISIVGHSAGGLLGADLLSRHPTAIKKLVAIGSPFSGEIPWDILRYATMPLLILAEKLSGLTQEKIVQNTSPHKDKVVTITTVHDDVVPPHMAAFPGAKNIVLKQNGPSYPSDNHCALPIDPRVIRMLRAELV